MSVLIRPEQSLEGTPFIDYVQTRVGRRPAQRVLAFIQEWDVLADELGREPTLEEYQRRWQMSRATAYNDQRLFQQAFPGDRTPRRILDALWDLRREEFGPLLAARVVESGGGGLPIEEGQLWLAEDGRFVRLQRVDGHRVSGEVDHEGTGWRRWSADRQELDRMRLVGSRDADVWRVAFQTSRAPQDLLGPLGRAGFVVDRVRSPDVDWEGGRTLRGGVVEARAAGEDREQVRKRLLAIPEVLAAGVEADDVRVRPGPSLG